MIRRIILIFIGIVYFSVASFAQDAPIDSLLSELEKSFGIEKLKVLNVITAHYAKENEKERFKYAKQAENLAENLLAQDSLPYSEDKTPFAKAYFFSGKNDFEKQHYLNAKTNFLLVEALNKEFSLTVYSEESALYLDSIESILQKKGVKQSKLFNNINNLRIGKRIKDVSLNASIQSEIKLGETKESLGNKEGAIEKYKNAINLLRNKGDFTKINELQLKISDLLGSLNKEEEAQTFLDSAILEREEVSPSLQTDSIKASVQELKIIADSLAANDDYESSLAYYQLYNELSNKLIQDSIQASELAKQKGREILLLKQQKKIADLNVEASMKENEKQLRLRNTILGITLLILIAALLILYFYFAKKREHKKLNKTHTALKQTKVELEVAEQKIISLLKQQVSEDIAEKLLVSSPEQMAESHFVCVLFLDIRNFTVRAEKMTPVELNAFQNSVFGFMIDCIERNHGNVNQLLGDGFMATFGAPISHGNDVQNAFNAANEILKELKRNIEASSVPDIRIGMGLHAGNVVVGNVGTSNRKQFSVTGKAVITASRVEQLNKKHNSQLIITNAVYQRLESNDTIAFLKSEDVLLKGQSNPTHILIIE